MTWQWAETFMPRLLAALAILVAGFIVAGWIQRALRRLLGGVSHVDPTLQPILGAAARYAVVVLTVTASLSQLSIQTASLLAVVGAAGVAVGLALQGTLSNIAAGIMLLWLRPFRIGDYIEVGSQSDTRNGGRLLSVDVSLPATAEFDRARRTSIEVAAKIPGVMSTPAPQIFLASVAGGALVLSLMAWTTAYDAGVVERAIVESVKRALDALGDDFKPTQIVRTVSPDNDPSRFLGGDSKR
ncbi:MAG: mechanosensitive ion channel family protein [Stellaceae bacterium]